MSARAHAHTNNLLTCPFNFSLVFSSYLPSPLPRFPCRSLFSLSPTLSHTHTHTHTHTQHTHNTHTHTHTHKYKHARMHAPTHERTDAYSHTGCPRRLPSTGFAHWPAAAGEYIDHMSFLCRNGCGRYGWPRICFLDRCIVNLRTL